MRYLLDTHVLLWLMHDPHLLPPQVLETLKRPDVCSNASLASLWEVAIKNSLGKLDLPADFDVLFPGSLHAAKIDLLDVKLIHVSTSRFLPWHHRDPFDRMLVAQAMVEGLILVPGDKKLSNYPVPIFW